MICSAVKSGGVCGRDADGIIDTPLGEIGVCGEHYDKMDGKPMLFSVNGERVRLGPPPATEPTAKAPPPTAKKWWPW